MPPPPSVMRAGCEPDAEAEAEAAVVVAPPASAVASTPQVRGGSPRDAKRTEYQSRGSAHGHALWWYPNALTDKKPKKTSSTL